MNTKISPEATRRMALANEVAAAEDALAEIQQAFADTVCRFEGGPGAPAPHYGHVGTASEVRQLLQRAAEAAKALARN